MTTNKSIAESTYNELLERKKKHEFFLRLIDQEINKKKSSNDKELAKKIEKSKEKKEKEKEKDKPKKTAKDVATKDEIKSVLNANKIEFKANMTKEELMTLVRKHNLVRNVEEKHKDKAKEKSKK